MSEDFELVTVEELDEWESDPHQPTVLNTLRMAYTIRELWNNV